jgi:hypothetical protein
MRFNSFFRRFAASISVTALLALIGSIIALLASVVAFFQRKEQISYSHIIVGVSIALLIPLIIERLINYLDNSKSTSSRRYNDKIMKGFDVKIDEKTIFPDIFKNSIASIISDHDKIAIVKNITDNISDDITNILSRDFERKYKAASVKNDHVNEIRKIFNAMRKRLLDEIDALQRRANINLLIGIVISIAAIVVLWLYVAAFESSNNDTFILSIPARLIIRLSLAIVIQIFAYFFLRLYRYAIFEIKFFQNEITAMELREASIEVALLHNDKSVASFILKAFAVSERNIILKKSETTINLKREDIERDYDKLYTGFLERMLNRNANFTTDGSQHD